MTEDAFKICPTCDGEGGWEESFWEDEDDEEYEWLDCYDCNGLGEVPRDDT